MIAVAELQVHMNGMGISVTEMSVVVQWVVLKASSFPPLEDFSFNHIHRQLEGHWCFLLAALSCNSLQSLSIFLCTRAPLYRLFFD